MTGTGEIRFGDLRRSESPFTISAAEVHFRGTSVKGEFPEGFRSVSDMDLTVRRAAGRTALSGTIDLVRGVYVKDFKLESSIGRPRASEVFRVPAGGLFAGIGLDLLVRASQDVWLRNDLGKIEGQGEVHVRGTTDRPSLAGRVTAVEGGTIRFRNVEYRVLGGTMDFADPEVINPIFVIFHVAVEHGRVGFQADVVGQAGGVEPLVAIDFVVANDVANAVRTQNIEAALGQVGQAPMRRTQAFQFPIDTLGRLRDPAAMCRRDRENLRTAKREELGRGVVKPRRVELVDTFERIANSPRICQRA